MRCVQDVHLNEICKIMQFEFSFLVYKKESRGRTNTTTHSKPEEKLPLNGKSRKTTKRQTMPLTFHTKPKD